MPTNLTGSTIASTFDQLLHVDGGPTVTEKVVYSGTGVATALKLGTASGSLAGIQFVENTIKAAEGAIIIGELVSFEDAEEFRSSLGLGSLAVQNASSVDITGGSIADVVFTGSIIGITSIQSDELIGGSVQLAGTTITNTEEGEPIQLLNAVLQDGEVPFDIITNLAYASFFDAGTTDQTGSTTTRTAIKWATASLTGAGVTVSSDSRITLTVTGTYRINTSLQFLNSDNAVRNVDVWFAKNGINIPNSAARLTVPKSSEGGTYLAAYEIFEKVVANDYLEMYWRPSNVSAKLHYIAAVAEVPGVSPAIPAIPPTLVVVQRIA
jgi:hypothetical protein